MPHWCKNPKPCLVQVPNYLTWTKSTPQKNWFFWANHYKIEVMITSLIEMLELPYFVHMTTSLKRTTLTFLAQICLKRKLGFQIQKTNVGIRISILEIPCVPIFRQNRQHWIFGSIFAQKWFLRSDQVWIRNKHP